MPTSDEIKLKPGQYLIRTPDNFEEVRVGRKVERIPRPYSGSAYGIVFQDNVAVIDDLTVAELREVMLEELDGDETRLPPWWQKASAADLARKIQSDFGYDVYPELPKLKRMTKSQILATSDIDDKGANPADAMAPRATADAPGEDSTQATRKRTAPVSGRTVLGVDAEADAGQMPDQPPTARDGNTVGSAGRRVKH